MRFIYLPILLVIIVVAAILWPPIQSFGQGPSSSGDKTFDPTPDWRPTHDSPQANYVGNTVCAQCHDKVKTQPLTLMGRALEVGGQNWVFKKYQQLTYRSGPYTYLINRQGDQTIYSVSKGQDTLSVPVLYSFGQGKIAQTYVLDYGGKFYESRVSFYGAIGGLDLTIGHDPDPPATLADALGRLLNTASVNDCFSCHATRAVKLGRLQFDRLQPGVTCEGCHGPGQDHVTLMSARLNPSTAETTRAAAGDKPNDQKIFNPGRFDTEGVTQFCGACHRSWIQVQMMNLTGVRNVRFQPYRLFNSKCYNYKDKRIACTACHDPHLPLATEVAYYDSKCIACHAGQRQALEQARKPSVCPVGKENCASCHMPKTELPGAHYKFTDHFIRVVRAGEAYPK